MEKIPYQDILKDLTFFCKQIDKYIYSYLRFYDNYR